MKRPLTRKVGAQYPLAEMDPKAWEKFPLLRGFFLDARFADTEDDRLPGRIVLSADPARWTVRLIEPTAALQLYLGAPTLSDLWKLVEASLGDDTSPWAPDKFAAARAPRKPTRGG